MHVIIVSIKRTMSKVVMIVTISWTLMEMGWGMPVREGIKMSPVIRMVMGIWMVSTIANM